MLLKAQRYITPLYLSVAFLSVLEPNLEKPIQF